MQQHDKTEPPPFTASLSMLRASPKGLVQLATDWLIQTHGNRSFETKDPRFQAVGEVMRAAPETFVGADGISWEDLNLTQFWSLYFEARKLGSVPAPLLEVLSPLSKAQLGKGAKDMMIVAARARDGISFGELLDLGAVRRSKLLMFSAYQPGARNYKSHPASSAGFRLRRDGILGSLLTLKKIEMAKHLSGCPPPRNKHGLLIKLNRCWSKLPHHQSQSQ